MKEPSDKPAAPLSALQERFCREYLIDLNGCQAAIRAGFSEKSAQSQSSQQMADPRIQARIAQLSLERMARVELTADGVLKGLLEIATADLGEAFDRDGSLKNLHDIPAHVRRAMSGVETETRREGRGESAELITTTKVKFWDKPKSLELLGKHLKLFIERHEHSFPELAGRMERARARAAQRAIEEQQSQESETNTSEDA